MKNTSMIKSFWRNPLLSWPTFFEDQEWNLPTLFHDGLTISEDEKNIYVEASMPGVDTKNIEVTFENGIVSVEGDAKEEEKSRRYYRKASRSFTYRTTLPGTVEKNTEPEAEYKNGVVTLTFKKVSSKEVKKIKVKSS